MPFNLGAGELLLILLVALLVLGPDKLPGAARNVGRMVSELRRMSSGFQAELRDALKEPVEGTPGQAAPPTPPAAATTATEAPDAPDGAGVARAEAYGTPSPAGEGGALQAPHPAAAAGEGGALQAPHPAAAAGEAAEAPRAGDEASAPAERRPARADGHGGAAGRGRPA